jgi:ubiquinone/menaquinone biosynthesis C-methylase UbiE
VEPGILTNLPYEDNSFDIVMSSDVLEHIHPEEADIVVSELVRVSRRHVFLSISLKVRRCRLTSSNPRRKRLELTA